MLAGALDKEGAAAQLASAYLRVVSVYEQALREGDPRGSAKQRPSMSSWSASTTPLSRRIRVLRG
jgi:hypothetical protein